MPSLNRRDFVGMLALAGIAGKAEADDTSPSTGTDVTRRLARFVVSSKPQDVPADVRKEATRTFLNWVGCAVGGSRHETVEIALAALAPFSGPAQATILGRHERLDILNAALING